jgi:hypothetical protein
MISADLWSNPLYILYGIMALNVRKLDQWSADCYQLASSWLRLILPPYNTSFNCLEICETSASVMSGKMCNFDVISQGIQEQSKGVLNPNFIIIVFLEAEQCSYVSRMHPALFGVLLMRVNPSSFTDMQLRCASDTH